MRQHPSLAPFMMSIVLIVALCASYAFLVYQAHGQEDNRQYDIKTQTNVQTDMAASPAAMLSVQVCQKGLSGQVSEGGFSIINVDGFCDQVKLAAVMLEAASLQRKLGNDEYADMYEGYYHAALEDANSLVTKTYYASLFDRISSAFVLPSVIIMGLIFLL